MSNRSFLPEDTSGPPNRLAAAAALAFVLAFVLALTGSLQAQEPEVPAVERDAPEEEREISEPEELEERIESPFQWIERSLRVGAVGGWRAADRGDLSFGPGAAEVAGARIRGRVSSPLSLEAGLSTGFSDRFVINPLAPGGPQAVDQVPLRWVALDGGLQLALTGARTWHRMQPYVLLGTGFAVGVDEPGSPLEIPPPPVTGDPDDGDEDPVDPETSLARPFLQTENGEEDELPDLSLFRYRMGTTPFFQIGLGTELLISERVGVSVEARNQIFRLRAPEGFFRQDVVDALEERGLAIPQERQWTNSLHLSLTFWYYL